MSLSKEVSAVKFCLSAFRRRCFSQAWWGGGGSPRLPPQRPRQHDSSSSAISLVSTKVLGRVALSEQSSVHQHIAVVVTVVFVTTVADRSTPPPPKKNPTNRCIATWLRGFDADKRPCCLFQCLYLGDSASRPKSIKNIPPHLDIQIHKGGKRGRGANRVGGGVQLLHNRARGLLHYRWR